MAQRNAIDTPRSFQPAAAQSAERTDAQTKSTASARKRSQHTPAPKRPSFAQAACMALLASPFSAMARMLAPPQTGRSLLGSCTTGDWGAAEAGSWNAITEPLSVERVDSSSLWVNARDNSCMPNGREIVPAKHLTYAFDSVVGSTSPFEPLLSESQDQVRQDLATLSSSLNLTFHEISAAPHGAANILFFRARTDGDGLPANSGFPPWVGTPPGVLLNPNVAGVFQLQYSSPQSARLAAIGASLGLTMKGAVGINGTNGAQGKFFTNTMSSVTFARENTCVNVDHLGPLDLAALAGKYGVAQPGMVQTYDLTDGNSSAGIVTSQALSTGVYVAGTPKGSTLRASYQGNISLQVSLEDNGNSHTQVGNTYRMLAPNSLMLNADINNTRGGIVIGNNGTNSLVGSPFDDVFRLGLGSSNVTTGNGTDYLLLQYPGANVTVTDFSAQDMIYVPYEKGSVTANTTSSDAGLSVQLPQSTTVNLLGVKNFNMSNLRFGISPSINNFVIAPCALQQSALVSPPPPPPPPPPPARTSSGSGSSYNPCASIGSAGMGGALGACGASLGFDTIVPQAAYAP